jgi:hypothetical protein
MTSVLEIAETLTATYVLLDTICAAFTAGPGSEVAVDVLVRRAFLAAR